MVPQVGKEGVGQLDFLHNKMHLFILWLRLYRMIYTQGKSTQVCSNIFGNGSDSNKRAREIFLLFKVPYVLFT